MFCPQCGARNADTENYCNQCGTPLRQAMEAQTTHQLKSQATPPAAEPVHVWTASQMRPDSSSVGSVYLDKLGERIDGWADLIDNQADQAAHVRELLLKRLRQRNMPQVTLSQQDVTLGGLMGESRPYQLSLHKIGTTIAVYVGEFGTDLYITWDVFVKLIWQW